MIRSIYRIQFYIVIALNRFYVAQQRQALSTLY